MHDIASDAHDVDGRPPATRDDLQAAAKGLRALRGQADWLTADAPAAILAGEPLPPRPPGGIQDAAQRILPGTRP